MKKLGKNIIKLNAGAGKRSVIEAIDRPIRPLVVEFNRIGLRTCFSCCGFTYDGEEEPKAHHRDTYVAFFGPDLKNPVEVEIFFNVVSTAKSLGWLTCLLSVNTEDPRGQEWIISWTPGNLLWAKDEEGGVIHDFEGRVVHIQALTDALKKLPTAQWVTHIVDGNERRKLAWPEWQVQPKQPISMSEALQIS